MPGLLEVCFCVTAVYPRYLAKCYSGLGICHWLPLLIPIHPLRIPLACDVEEPTAFPQIARLFAKVCRSPPLDRAHPDTFALLVGCKGQDKTPRFFHGSILAIRSDEG